MQRESSRVGSLILGGPGGGMRWGDLFKHMCLSAFDAPHPHQLTRTRHKNVWQRVFPFPLPVLTLQSQWDERAVKPIRQGTETDQEWSRLLQTVLWLPYTASGTRRGSDNSARTIQTCCQLLESFFNGVSCDCQGRLPNTPRIWLSTDVTRHSAKKTENLKP